MVNEYDMHNSTTVKVQENEFFAISENAPAAEKAIVEEMQKQLKETDVQDFLTWHGQPMWSKILRFEKDKNGSVTYAIPTQNNKEITGFFAATIDKSNAIKFEMHRQIAVELKKGEYSYANITTQQSKTLLDYFSSKSAFVNESAASENTSSTWSCYWLWVEVTTLQKTNGNQQNMEDPGGYWELRCIYQGGGGGGGTGGGDPGGGGTGGGGTGGCGGGGGNTEVFNYNWWNNEASLLTPCELIAVINRLSPILNLTALQIHYLMARPARTEEIDRYLTNNPQNTQIAKDHLNKLTQDIDYNTFVEGHAQTGDPLKMWWEDEVWLRLIKYQMSEWAFNFYMQNTRPANKKPEEFSNKCDGLKEMALRTKSQIQEILGYVTYDNKLIITDMGNPESVNMNLLKLNGYVYYYYPLSLGLPSLSYHNMVVDSVNQRILIPIRNTVHTHVAGGYSIDYIDARSEGDLRNAMQLDDMTYITNYVIEPFGSTYKTGKFNSDEYNNNYIDVHIGLTLEEICQHINL